MAKVYVTLTGEKIDLSSLTAEEKVLLGRVVKAYETGEAYPNFVNRVNAPGSPALGGGQWVTAKVARSPLYRVCQDLADRLGIAQGFLALGKNSSTERTGFVETASEPDFVSSEEAAHRIGVTAEAIRKAIREKRLPARQVGRTYLLERKAVDAYAARSGLEVSIAVSETESRAPVPRAAGGPRRPGIPSRRLTTNLILGAPDPQDL
jgi:excisionase family DNA binding protein